MFLSVSAKVSASVRLRDVFDEGTFADTRETASVGTAFDAFIPIRHMSATEYSLFMLFLFVMSFSLTAEGVQVTSWVDYHDRHCALVNDFSLFRTEYDVV